jgi:DNA helicase-2/ATP-dependent DNA helicase PcrA
MDSFGSPYETPGWQRAQANRAKAAAASNGLGDHRSDKPFGSASKRRGPLTIEGELVAKSTGTVSAFSLGDRVFHQKFGNGNITAIDGNKLTIQFDRAGEKRVVDSFVERV